MQDTHLLETIKVDSYIQGYGYTIFIDEDIAESAYYRNVLKVLSMAGEGDHIRMVFDTHGGFGSTAMVLTHAMDNCKAKITGVLAGNCMSAGTIMALHCHDWEIGAGLNWMAHTASFGVGGEAPKVAKRHEYEQKQIKALLYREYSGFYTPDEIEAIANGDESWLDASEVDERLQNFQKYQQEQYIGMQEDIENALWDENNKAIEETLKTLDFSDKEKETFEKVRKALDDSLTQEPSSILDNVTSEVVAESDEDCGYVVLLGTEGESLGNIYYSIDDEGNLVLEDLETPDGGDVICLNTIFLSDHREVVKQLLVELDIVFKNSDNTQRLVKKLLDYLKEYTCNIIG